MNFFKKYIKIENSISVDETSTEFQASTTNLANIGLDVSSSTKKTWMAASGGGAERHQQYTPPVIFGASLGTMMQCTGQPLPQTILEAMRFIRKASSNEIGLFRKNGNKARINKLKEIINKNEAINFQSSDITVFDIADTIKLYFRELPECLITNKLSDILLSNYLSNKIIIY